MPSLVNCWSARAPRGVGVEVEAVAAVVERVEEGGERVVLAELARVAAHLVGDPLALGGRVPDPGGDVDVGLVEQDPRLGPLGGGRADVGHLLYEVGDGGHRLVDRLVEHAVEPDALGEPDRPDRGAARLVAVHHLGRDGGRRSVDERRERRGGAGQKTAGSDGAGLGRGGRGGRRGRPTREGRRGRGGPAPAGSAPGRRTDRGKRRPPGPAGSPRRHGPLGRRGSRGRVQSAGRRIHPRCRNRAGRRRRRRQREHHAVLQIEQFVRGAVDDRGAEDVAGGHGNHPGGDAKPAAESLIGPDQHGRDVEGAAHAGGFLHRHRRTRRFRHRGAVPLHDDRGPRRKPRHEPFGDAPPHPVVGRIPRQVGERHDGHPPRRRAAGRDRGRLRRRPGRRQRNPRQHRPYRRHPMHTSRSHVHQLLIPMRAATSTTGGTPLVTPCPHGLPAARRRPSPVSTRAGFHRGAGQTRPARPSDAILREIRRENPRAAASARRGAAHSRLHSIRPIPSAVYRAGTGRGSRRYNPSHSADPTTRPDQPRIPREGGPREDLGHGFITTTLPDARGGHGRRRTGPARVGLGGIREPPPDRGRNLFPPGDSGAPSRPSPGRGGAGSPCGAGGADRRRRLRRDVPRPAQLGPLGRRRSGRGHQPHHRREARRRRRLGPQRPNGVAQPGLRAAPSTS